MMKSLVRWSATLGLVGSTLLGSFCMENLQALALPDDQVAQRLQPIPVFTITDAQGAPLVASVPNSQNKSVAVAPAFISQRDAQAFIEKLKSDKPDLAKAVQVVPVSMGEVYKLARANQDKPEGLNFQYVPVQQQVQSAQAIVSKPGQQAQQFLGTPLFVATGASDQEFIVFGESKQVIPFFFAKEQLQEIVDKIKQQKPDTKIQITVVPLESVIQKLQTSNDQFVEKIQLIRSPEADQFVQSLPAPKSGNQPQAAPQRPR